MDILLIPYISSITVSGNVGDITKYTSPLKLFDYLCAGKMIICSDYDVFKEIIQNKKNAIFIKNYKNPYSWKNEIFKLKSKEEIVILAEEGAYYNVMASNGEGWCKN